MGLFQLPKRPQVNESSIINKINNARNTEPKLKIGKDSLLATINNIKMIVETKLGKYKDNYVLINTKDELNKYIDKILECGECSLDTETTGKDAYSVKIVGASLHYRGAKAIYIPLGHISYIDNSLSTSNMPLEDFKECISRLNNEDLTINYQNAKYDLKVIYYNLGILLKTKIWDTLLAGKALGFKEASLKVQNAKLVEHTDEMAKFNDLFDGIPFQYIPIKYGYLYAAKDAEMTSDVKNAQFKLLETQPRVFNMLNMIEMPCIWATLSLELNGALIDQEYSLQLHNKYIKLLDDTREAVYKELSKYNAEIETYKRFNIKHKLSTPINIDSSTQLAIFFYDILKIKPVDKKNPRGTGEEILEKINLPICKAILDYRGNKKLMTTYIDKLPNVVLADGRIHCLFNQMGTDTGRYSSSEPNLQNIPSHNTDIRPMFTTPKGYVMLGSDFSQQEMRLLAAICKDKGMIKAYQEGKDIYAWVASLMYHVPYEECKEFRSDGTTNKEGKQRRSNAKAIALGINYSKGPKSIAEGLGIPEKEGQKIYDTFMNEFPTIKDFIASTQASVRKKGFTETLFGRRRYLPDMQLEPYEFTRDEAKPKNFDPTDFDAFEELDYSITQQEKEYWTRRLNKAYGFKQTQNILEEARAEGLSIKNNTMKIIDAERQCVNAVVQGTAADQTKLALISLVNNQELKDLGFRLIIIVHDEIIGECPIENAKRCGEILSYTMAHSLDEYIDMPFKCDVEYSKCWYGESIDLDKELANK